jgi:hypothetical protein
MDNVLASAPSLPIDADLPCSGCNYNLKGLPTDANCPECGQPIAQTLGFGLIHRDPAWLRQQAAVVPWLAALCVNRVIHPELYYPNHLAVVYIGYGINIAVAGLALVACWKLSIPEPQSTAPADEGGSIRRGVRLAAVVVLALNVAGLPLFHHGSRSLYERPFGPLSYALPLAFAVTQFLVLLLLSQLARRSGSRSLDIHARLTLYVFPSLSVAAVIFYGIPIFDLSALPEVAMIVNQTLSVVGVAALFAMLLLLGRMHEVLRTAASAGSAATS